MFGLPLLGELRQGLDPSVQEFRLPAGIARREWLTGEPPSDCEAARAQASRTAGTTTRGRSQASASVGRQLSAGKPRRSV